MNRFKRISKTAIQAANGDIGEIQPRIIGFTSYLCTVEITHRAKGSHRKLGDHFVWPKGKWEDK